MPDKTFATKDDKREYAEICRRCGCGEKSWHHDPPIGGSALDHTFTPSRSQMEALLSIGGGRPFHSIQLNDIEYYALRSWAKKGLEHAAEGHEPQTCERRSRGCNLCVMLVVMESEERARAEFEAEQRDLAERYTAHG